MLHDRLYIASTFLIYFYLVILFIVILFIILYLMGYKIKMWPNVSLTSLNYVLLILNCSYIKFTDGKPNGYFFQN